MTDVAPGKNQVGEGILGDAKVSSISNHIRYNRFSNAYERY